MIISLLDLLPSIIIKVHNIKKLGMPRTAWTMDGCEYIQKWFSVRKSGAKKSSSLIEAAESPIL